MRFFRSYGAFWLYTVLRFALFFALWAIVWVVGVPGLIGAFIALVLSVPLSWVLLARPRRAFAASIESRVDTRRARSHDLEARLAAAGADPADDAQAPGTSGPSGAPAGADPGPDVAGPQGHEIAPGVWEAPAPDRTERR